MTSFIVRVAGWVQRRSENVIAALLGIMFVAFLCQIVFRYFLNLPTGWSTETVVVCWLWLVLWGTALALKEKDEIRFDIFISVAGPRVRRVMAIIVSVATVALYSLSLPGTYKYVTFMKVEQLVVPRHPPRLAVLDLRHLRRRDHPALSVVAVGGLAR